MTEPLFKLPSFADEEKVTFYPAYGYRDGTDWKIPLRVWVHEPRALVENMIARMAKSFGDLDDKEINNFKTRIADFVADNESGEKVVFKFDHDADDEEYRVQTVGGSFPESNRNGLIEGFITLSETKAQKLLSSQGSANHQLTYRATSKEHHGVGRIQLIAPQGRSVISDIDDTIKITEILAGAKTVIRNTFFRDFAAVPGMAQMYRDFGDAAFHYVSGSPYQLYRPLAAFLFNAETGFPEGTFHLKTIPTNLLSASSWEDLQDLVGEHATFNQKIDQISEIMARFPGRKFILIGDSGEKDPEVYREIQKKFPTQVEEIRIRDLNIPRLQGTTIIP
jgi:phosphatidate phosphatase APP1